MANPPGTVQRLIDLANAGELAGFNGPSHFAFRGVGDAVASMTIRA
jgi:hypothetical protein